MSCLVVGDADRLDVAGAMTRAIVTGRKSSSDSPHDTASVKNAHAYVQIVCDDHFTQQRLRRSGRNLVGDVRCCSTRWTHSCLTLLHSMTSQNSAVEVDSAVVQDEVDQ